MYKRKKWKTIKKQAAEAYSEPCQMSMMECFCKNVTAVADPRRDYGSVGANNILDVLVNFQEISRKANFQEKLNSESKVSKNSRSYIPPGLPRYHKCLIEF